MPKNKRQKYQRVKTLPNVTIAESDTTAPPGPHAWDERRYAGMRRVLELGCGRGEHSLAFAAADPGGLCVGVDRKSDRMCAGAEAALAMGLDNVHFLRARIEWLDAYFSGASIHAIWLTFPDPHPKARKVRHRLTAPAFLDLYARLLVPGGRVHLKTDSGLLVDYTGESIRARGGRIVAASPDIHAADGEGMGAPGVMSAYERAARQRGETIKYLAFTLT